MAFRVSVLGAHSAVHLRGQSAAGIVSGVHDDRSGDLQDGHGAGQNRRCRHASLQSDKPSESARRLSSNGPATLRAICQQRRSDLQRLPAAQMVKMRVSVLAVLAAVVMALNVAPAATSRVDRLPLSRDIVLSRIWGPDEQPLTDYRALRHITASTRGGRMSASMDAWTSLDKNGKFSFEIVSESGSSLIRNRVLRAALEAERDSQTPEAREQAALSTANYEFFEIRPEAGHLLKIDIKPRRKHVMLVDGALFLEEETADLVRIEGELPK